MTRARNSNLPALRYDPNVRPGRNLPYLRQDYDWQAVISLAHEKARL